MFSLASHFPSLSPAQLCWVEVEFSSKLLKKNQPKVYRIPADTWTNFVLCFLLNTLTSRWKASEIPVFVLLAVGRWQWHWAVRPLQVPQTCIFHCSHLRAHRRAGGRQQAVGTWWHLTGALGSPHRSWGSRSLPEPRWQEPQLSRCRQGPTVGAGGAVSPLPSLPWLAAVSRKSFRSCFSLLSCKMNGLPLQLLFSI